MVKNTTAATAADIINFLCVSIFRCAIKYHPIATKIALNTMKVVLIVGKIGKFIFIHPI